MTIEELKKEIKKINLEIKSLLRLMYGHKVYLDKDEEKYNSLKNKKDELLLEWYLKRNDIHDMDTLNFNLRKYTPENILQMVEDGDFTLKDKYFRIDEDGNLESISSKEIEEAINLLEEHLLEELGEDNNGIRII